MLVSDIASYEAEKTKDEIQRGFLIASHPWADLSVVLYQIAAENFLFARGPAQRRRYTAQGWRKIVASLISGSFTRLLPLEQRQGK
jgi:hypothetical protein